MDCRTRGGRDMNIFLAILLWLLGMVSISFAVEVGIIAAWEFFRRPEKKDKEQEIENGKHV